MHEKHELKARFAVISVRSGLQNQINFKKKLTDFFFFTQLLLFKEFDRELICLTCVPENILFSVIADKGFDFCLTFF